MTIVTLLAFTISANNPEMTIEVSKTQFLFLKWINFTSSYSNGDGTRVVLDTRSKFYIFADYYGKVVSGEMKVNAVTAIPCAEPQTSVALIADVDDDNFIVSKFTIKRCLNDDRFSAWFWSVDLKEDSFMLKLSISCTCCKDNLPSAIEEIENTTDESVRKIRDGPNDLLMPDFPSGIKNSSEREVAMRESLKRHQNVILSSEERVAKTVHVAVQEQ